MCSGPLKACAALRHMCRQLRAWQPQVLRSKGRCLSADLQVLSEVEQDEEVGGWGHHSKQDDERGADGQVDLVRGGQLAALRLHSAPQALCQGLEGGELGTGLG